MFPEDFLFCGPVVSPINSANFSSLKEKTISTYECTNMFLKWTENGDKKASDTNILGSYPLEEVAH